MITLQMSIILRFIYIRDACHHEPKGRGDLPIIAGRLLHFVRNDSIGLHQSKQHLSKRAAEY